MPTKPSQMTTSAEELKRSRPSTLPMKLTALEGAEHGEGVAGEGVAFGVFFTDGEEADAGVGDLEDVAGIHGAHDGELEEIFGVGIDVGAYVQQQGGAADGGDDGGEGGAVDAGEAAEDHLGGCHGGAGVACGEEALGEAFADALEADAHGGIALGTDGLGGFVVHGDPLGGIDDGDLAIDGAGGEFTGALHAGVTRGLGGGEAGTEGIAERITGLGGAEGGGEGGLENFFRAYEGDADVERTARENGPANFRLGGLI